MCARHFYGLATGGGITILANRYRVIKRLSKGGMGSVYLAEDNKLHMKWAVKEIGEASEFYEFTRKSEVSVLRSVSHPNLPRVTDIFDENKKTYMVMDYIEGRTLEEILSSDKKIPSVKFYQWSIEITSALSYLHSMNPPVIYRDMKPSNIMIRPSGSAVLIDFGTAKGSADIKDEYALGTKKYAAPEQYDGISDKRSDIYSLGRVIGEMAGNGANILIKRICKKCTRRMPEKRYRSAENVKRDLIISRDIYKYALVFAAVLFLTAGGIYKSTQVAEASKKDIEEINESGRMNGLYDDALMCFYELKDYDAALGYFERIDETQIPEAAYYKELCGAMLSSDCDMNELIPVVEKFRDFNESEMEFTDPKRKLKNDADIARIYLICSDTSHELADRAVSLLTGIDESYRKQEGWDKGEVREAVSYSVEKNTLALLEAAYRQKARYTEAKEKEENLLLAIRANHDLIELVRNEGDESFITRRYLNNARMYEELKAYKKAEEEYESSEKEYPYVNEDIYLGHLRLLISGYADEEKIKRLYKEALKVDGMTENREFKKISERTGYGE